MTQRRITDDLQALLDVLPPKISTAVVKADDSDNLLEIVLDLGRIPVARFVHSEVILSENEITRADIDTVVDKIGEFDADLVALAARGKSELEAAWLGSVSLHAVQSASCDVLLLRGAALS